MDSSRSSAVIRPDLGIDRSMSTPVLAIDLGGTTAKIAMIGTDVSIVGRSEVPVLECRNVDDLIRRIVDSAETLISEAAEEPRACGVGVPGFVDADSGVVVEGARNIEMVVGHSLSAPLEEAFGLPVRVDNDGTCAAAGELAFGWGDTYDHFVVITLGTGIGSGIVIGGQLYRGADGFAGEVGHISVDPNGIDCNCGSRGCLEQYASAPSLVRTYNLRAAKRGVARIASRDARELFERAARGDPLARAAIDDAAERLAQVIGGLVNTLNLQAVVLAGGMSRAGSAIVNPVTERLRDFTWPTLYAAVELRVSKLTADAGLFGAAGRALLEL